MTMKMKIKQMGGQEGLIKGPRGTTAVPPQFSTNYTNIYYTIILLYYTLR